MAPCTGGTQLWPSVGAALALVPLLVGTTLLVAALRSELPHAASATATIPVAKAAASLSILLMALLSFLDCCQDRTAVEKKFRAEDVLFAPLPYAPFFGTGTAICCPGSPNVPPIEAAGPGYLRRSSSCAFRRPSVPSSTPVVLSSA